MGTNVWLVVASQPMVRLENEDRLAYITSSPRNLTTGALMITLPITTLLTSLLTIWLLVLTYNVIKRRQSTSVSLEAGDDETLRRRIRAHGNLTEYAPMMVLMTGLAEFQGGNFWIVGILAAMFLIGRLFHGYALSFSEHNPGGRIRGMILTLIALVLMVAHNLVLLVF
ncbi:MAG: MAPEG family protein [Pseudomonadota bacterium]